mgnify:CR=1 FL=1
MREKSRQLLVNFLESIEIEITKSLKNLYQKKEQSKNYLNQIDDTLFFVDKESKTFFLLYKTKAIDDKANFYYLAYQRAYFDYQKDDFNNIIKEKNKEKQIDLLKKTDLYLGFKGVKKGYNIEKIIIPEHKDIYQQECSNIKNEIDEKIKRLYFSQKEIDQEIENKLGYVRTWASSMAANFIMLNLLSENLDKENKTDFYQFLLKNGEENVSNADFLDHSYSYDIRQKFTTLENYNNTLIETLHYLWFLVEVNNKKEKKFIYNDLDNAVYGNKKTIHLTSQNFHFVIEKNNNDYDIYDLGEYSYNKNFHDLKKNKTLTISKSLSIKDNKINFARDYAIIFLFELDGAIYSFEEEAKYHKKQFLANQEKKLINSNLKKQSLKKNMKI